LFMVPAMYLFIGSTHHQETEATTEPVIDGAE